MQKAGIEIAIDSLTDLLNEATDCTKSRSQEELDRVYDTNGKIEKAGPPKDIPEWVKEAMEELERDVRQ